VARSDAIGAGSVILTANADGLSAGLDKAAADVGTWKTKTEKMAAGGGGKGGGSGGGGILGGMLGKAGGFALAAGGAVASIGTITAAVGELKDIGSTLRTGEVFGVDPAKFSGMAGLVKSMGGGVRELSESLVTQGKLADDAVKGIPTAKAAFDSLGLDPAQFKTMDVVDQFYAAFDAISRIEQPTDRVRAAMALWGEDGGKNLLPFIGKTAGELKGMASGFALTSAQAEKATAANQAVAKAGALLDAAWQRTAVAMAPVIEFGARLVEKAQPALEWFGRAAERTFTIFGAALVEIGGFIGRMIENTGDWINEILGISEPWPSIEDTITAALKGVWTAGAFAWDALKAGIGGVAVAVGKLVDAFDDLSTQLNDIAGLDVGKIGTGKGLQEWGKKQVSEFGQSAAQLDTWFAKILDRQKAVANGPTGGGGLGGAAPRVQEIPKLSGALMAGSADAYKSVVKWQLQQQTAGMGGAADPAKQAVTWLQRIEAGIRKLVDKPGVNLIPG
jgi:hypothetical protein